MNPSWTTIERSAKTRKFLFLLVIFVSCCLHGTSIAASNNIDADAESDDTNGDVVDIVNAIEKLIRFYSDNYEKMNLDGLFGLRVLEGQLLNVLEGAVPEGREIPRISPPILERLQTVYRLSRTISSNALPILFASDPEYASHFLPLMQSPFRKRNPRKFAIRKLDPSLIWEKKSERMAGSEARSDFCLVSLMGTKKKKDAEEREEGETEDARRRGERSGERSERGKRRKRRIGLIGGEEERKARRGRRRKREERKEEEEDNHNVGKRCEIPPKCVAFMLKRETVGYLTTHQLLYAHLASVHGCDAEFSAAAGAAAQAAAALDGADPRLGVDQTIDSWTAELCVNVAVETNNSIQLNTSDPSNPFSATVHEGLQDLFMEQLFVCGMLGFVEILSVPVLRSMLRWQKDNGCFGQEAPSPTTLATRSTIPKRRLLLESSVGEDGCLSHKTGVAIGALAVHLYYAIFAPDAVRSQPYLVLDKRSKRERPFVKFLPVLPEELVSYPPLGESDEKWAKVYVFIFFVLLLGVLVFRQRFSIFRMFMFKFRR